MSSRASRLFGPALDAARRSRDPRFAPEAFGCFLNSLAERDLMSRGCHHAGARVVAMAGLLLVPRISSKLTAGGWAFATDSGPSFAIPLTRRMVQASSKTPRTAGSAIAFA